MPTNVGQKAALLKQNKQLIPVQCKNFGLEIVKLKPALASGCRQIGGDLIPSGEYLDQWNGGFDGLLQGVKYEADLPPGASGSLLRAFRNKKLSPCFRTICLNLCRLTHQ